MVSSRWFSEDAAALPDCISNLYSFQPLPVTGTDALARTWPDWSATSAIRTGSVTPGIALGEKRTRVLGIRPHGDSPVAFIEETRRAVGVGLRDFEFRAVA